MPMLSKNKRSLSKTAPGGIRVHSLATVLYWAVTPTAASIINSVINSNIDHCGLVRISMLRYLAPLISIGHNLKDINLFSHGN